MDGTATSRGDSGMTLIVESDTGVVLYRIAQASTLPSDVNEITQGPAAETATHRAAAVWGMPDFMFSSPQEKKGNSVREVGDGLLVVGNRGAVLQVKSRVALTEDADEEIAWLNKVTSKAIKQAQGTVRRLQSAATIQLRNQRGRRVEVGTAGMSWVSVVVIDHPQPPSGWTPNFTDVRRPTVVLLRRDWEFLLDHLRSAWAVLGYLHRVAGTPVELGTEPVRYHQYALADESAPADPVHPSVSGFGGQVVSTPRAPLSPASGGDTDAHLVYRIIMEDFAMTALDEQREADRLWLLGQLDGLPVAARSELGTALLGFMKDAGEFRGDGALTHTRLVTPNPGEFGPMVFMVASAPAQESRDTLYIRTQLLHHDYQQATHLLDLTTVGVLLSPSSVPGRTWDTSLTGLQGDQGLTEAQVAEMRTLLDDARERVADGSGACEVEGSSGSAPAAG